MPYSKNVRGKMQQVKMPEATWYNVIGNNPISKNARDKTYTSLVLYLSSMQHKLTASWEKGNRCNKSIYVQIDSPTLYIGRV